MTRTLSLVSVLCLSLQVSAATPAGVTVTKTKDAVEFKIKDEVVSRYHVAETVAKPYFWPLLAPGGVPVTRGWPMEKGLPKETTDHPHQKSAWFCHGDVIADGLEYKMRSSDKRVKGVDFWSETPGHGKIVCVSVSEPKSAGAVGSVVTKNEWRAPDGTKVMDEERTIVFENLGDGRLFILEIDLHASVAPITFGDTKEGSMGVRVNDEMKVKGGVFGEYVNAEGKKNEKDVWGRRSAWNDYSGSVGTAKAGIAVFDHPKNPRAAWHSREYGLMAANPFGRSEAGFPDLKGLTDLVKIAKGEHLKLKYALYLHSGDAMAGKVAEAYEAFSKR